MTKCFEDLCLVSFFLSVEDDLTFFLFSSSPFCIAEVSELMEAYDVNQFGTCITCKCYEGSIQRFMINVLCWSPESTTYELRSEHTKSIFSISLHTHNLLPAAFSAPWNKFADIFFFFIMTVQPEGGVGLWCECRMLEGFLCCTVYVACVGLSESHICVRLCTISVICVKMNICQAKQSRMMSISGHL